MKRRNGFQWMKYKCSINTFKCSTFLAIRKCKSELPGAHCTLQDASHEENKRQTLVMLTVKENSHTQWGECIILVLWKSVWDFSKIKTKQPYVLYNSWTTSQKTQVSIQQRCLESVFIVAIFTMAKSWNQPMYPVTDSFCTQWSFIQS